MKKKLWIICLIVFSFTACMCCACGEDAKTGNTSQETEAVSLNEIDSPDGDV